MSLLKKIVCMFLMQGIFCIQPSMPNNSNNIFPKISKNNFYLFGTCSIVGISLLYGFYFLLFKKNKQNNNQPVESKKNINIKAINNHDKTQLAKNNIFLKAEYYMKPPYSCGELLIYSNISREISIFDGSSYDNSECKFDYLVRQLTTERILSTPNLHRALSVLQACPVFFNYQLWSIKMTHRTYLRHIRYCNDIENINKYFEPFYHGYSLIDDCYPLNLFLFDGPNRQNYGMLAYNTRRSDTHDSNGTVLCLDLTKPSVEIPAEHEHLYIKHEFEGYIITAAALHPNDNIMLCATQVSEDGQGVASNMKQKYMVNIINPNPDNFTILSSYSIHCGLIKVMWTCNQSWYGLTFEGDVVTEDKYGTKPETIVSQEKFDHIAVDQNNVDDQNIKIVGITTDGCVNLYNKLLEKIAKITTIQDYKKAKVCRLSLVGNQIGLLLNNSGESKWKNPFYDYKKLHLYTIDS